MGLFLITFFYVITFARLTNNYKAMKDLRQTDKDQIFDKVNDLKVTITFDGFKYPAKLYGRLLAFPSLRANNNYIIEAQINWTQAERLAKGEITNIDID